MARREVEEVDQEALAAEAFMLLRDAILNGQIMLSTGRLEKLDADQVLNTAKWAAQNLKARKPKLLADTRELGLKKTRRTEDAAQG